LIGPLSEQESRFESGLLWGIHAENIHENRKNMDNKNLFQMTEAIFR
jgi:hypothetical protein